MGVWGVEVNEIAVLTYGGSDREWWVKWRAYFEPRGRITALGHAIPGDVVHVACTSREAAKELMASWAENGWIHKSAAKVRELKPADVPDRAAWDALVKLVAAVQEVPEGS